MRTSQGVGSGYLKPDVLVVMAVGRVEVVVVTINCPPGPITTCVSGSFREEEGLGLRGGDDEGVGDATTKLPSRVMTT